MGRRGPEAKIQDALKTYLEGRGWLVEVMHGNAFQRGIPDLYLFHPKYRERWVDCKVEGRYSFTRDQRQKWPIWASYGIGLWILTGADQVNYDKLFAPPNWQQYWKKSWGQLPSIEEMLDAIDREID